MNLKSGAFIINLNVAQSFSSRIFNFYSVFKLVAMLKKIVDNQYVLVTIHPNFLLWAGFLPSSKAPSLVTASQTGLPWILDAPTLSRWSFPFMNLLSSTAHLLPPTLNLSLHWPHCPSGGRTFLPRGTVFSVVALKTVSGNYVFSSLFPFRLNLKISHLIFFLIYLLPLQRTVRGVWGIHLNRAKYLGILS